MRRCLLDPVDWRVLVDGQRAPVLSLGLWSAHLALAAGQAVGEEHEQHGVDGVERGDDVHDAAYVDQEALANHECSEQP